MSYRGAVSKEVAKHHESRLKKFTGLYLLVGAVVLALSLAIPQITLLWKDNVIFGVGSYVVYGSLLQNKYFDVKKNSNPSFIGVHPGIFSPAWGKIELMFKHIWVVGSLLLFVSRWIKF